ncbi:MAG: hypothetical protein K9G67_12165 [Bacteroidales bacterium]|nr:hypothetical protein [Bacteroidales bacterium]MCF8351930.1 hypothetical protein [Bacteroidales bacterium]MCF8377103.1 hypothetical protein [Bacteroidales bacterium]
MKKLALILTAVFLIGSFTTMAQMHQGQNQQNDQQQSMMMQHRGMMQNMMGAGMMQNMMKGGMCPMCGMMMNQKMPMKKYMLMVNMLPNMQQQLSLSDEQVDKMIDLQTEFKKQQVDYQAELTKKQMKMEQMLNNIPSADEAKKQMQQCADTKIKMKVAAYETAKEMKALLTEKQQESLKSMMMNQGGMMQ